ncbi:MAG: peptidoglycan-binding protein [Acidobacteriota bacterium]|nr:peptidoglycan-binding protein [Acidobacteriota bacterium]
MRRHLRPTHLIALSLLLVILGVSAASLRAQTRATAKKKTQQTGSRKGKAAKRAPGRRDKGQKAPTPERVSEIQQALAKDGSFPGSPNGKWDDSTVSAMKRFQAGHGLNPSGKLDAKTLQQLGLGSRTAGIAPPMPSAKVSSASRLQAGSEVRKP